MRRMREYPPMAPGLGLSLVLVWACSGEGGPAGEAAAVHASVGTASQPADGTLLHLEARLLRPDGLWAEASFKVERKGGERLRDFELEIGNAPPGVAHDLALDGIALGQGVIGREGQLELEVSEEDEQLFPPGFADPKAGSILRVGELMELRFDELVELTELEAHGEGPGPLAGEVDYDVERLGDEVSRRFAVSVEHGPIATVHPVTLDGVRVGDLVLDEEGEGRLEYSTKRPWPFPASFPEPRPGSVVQVGDLFRYELRDALAGSPGH